MADTKLIDKLLKEYKESSARADLKEQNKILIKEVEKLRNIVELITESQNPRKRLAVQPYYTNGVDEATALLVVSDIHIEKKITKEETNGYNELNPDIAARRVHTCFKNAAKVINKSKEIKIPHLVIALLGDIVHGYIHEEYLTTNYMTPIEATLYAYDVLNDAFRYIKELKIKDVTVVCKVGNHSRITRRTYASGELTHSYEYILYHLLRKANPEFHWIIEDSYLTYLRVYDKDLRFHHGHAFGYSGGIGGIFPPMMSWISRQNKTKLASLDVMGHWHTRIWIPDMVLVNGALCGFDSYQSKRGFRAEPPSQQLVLVDKRRGFTINYPIIVE